jgi:hypothetical protein
MRNGHSIDADGYEYYYINDCLHREDGPALISPTGYRAWFINGVRHREDGPAEIYSSGLELYWLNGECLLIGSKKEFDQYKRLIAFI